MMQMFVLFHLSSAVVCPKLTVPDNGGVVPSSCSQTDVEYGTRCVFYCNDGYELSGPRYTGCQNNTSWSEIASLSCVRGQFLKNPAEKVSNPNPITFLIVRTLAAC